MNTITPISFKANYQPIRKISNVTKPEITKISQEVAKNTTNTKSIFQKFMAITGLSALFTKFATDKKTNIIEEVKEEEKELTNEEIIAYNQVEFKELSSVKIEKEISGSRLYYKYPKFEEVSAYSTQAIIEIIKEGKKDNNNAELLKEYLKGSSEMSDLEVIETVKMLKTDDINIIKKDLEKGKLKIKDAIYYANIQKKSDKIKSLLQEDKADYYQLSIKDKSFLMDCIELFYTPGAVSDDLLKDIYKLIKYYEQYYFNSKSLEKCPNKLKNTFEKYGESYLYVSNIVDKVAEYWIAQSRVMYDYGFNLETIADHAREFNNNEDARRLMKQYLTEPQIKRIGGL